MQNGKEKIIERILSDNKAKCKRIIEDAETRAAQMIADAKSEVESDALRLNAKLAADSKEALRRALAASELDSKKYLLGCKQNLLTSVFAAAEQKINALSEAKYLALMKKLLKSHSQKGEQLIICQKDKSVLTQTVAAEFGLKLVDQVGDFEGGFILQGQGYTKNLTLAVITEQLRIENEIEVAKILFEGA